MLTPAGYSATVESPSQAFWYHLNLLHISRPAGSSPTRGKSGVVETAGTFVVVNCTIDSMDLAIEARVWSNRFSAHRRPSFSEVPHL